MYMKTMQQDRSPTIHSVNHMAKPVHFFCEAPKARAVYLVGDFNDWDPSADAMTRQVDGWWFVEVDLTRGHHLYRFMIDGGPKLDPRASGVALDEKGEQASVTAVG